MRLAKRKKIGSIKGTPRGYFFENRKTKEQMDEKYIEIVQILKVVVKVVEEEVVKVKVYEVEVLEIVLL